MANVLNNEKKQQVIALGQLGWSLRRIQAATHVRRETISTYLKTAGVEVWPPGGWGRQTVSKAAEGVTTDFGVELSTLRPENQDPVSGDTAKAAIGVTTGFGVELRGPESKKLSRNPSASACEPFHRKLRQLRFLRRRFDCYRVERTSSRAGLAPAEVQRLSRRT